MAWKRPKDDGGEPIEAYLVEKFDPETGVWMPVGKTLGNVPEMEVFELLGIIFYTLTWNLLIYRNIKTYSLIMYQIQKVLVFNRL